MYKYRHFLNFKDIPDLGPVEILEPVGFDASSHKVEQGEFFGRDVVKANEEIELSFTRDTFGILTNPLPNIDGIRQTHLSHAFDWILNVIESFGWETEIEWTLIDQMGLTHVVGIIDVFTAGVEFDCIKFNVIQHTNRELIKRRKDVVVNAFSDKDLDGNTITPCVPTEVIITAKPIVKSSSWVMPPGALYVDLRGVPAQVAINPARQLKVHEISASYIPNTDVLNAADGSPTDYFRIIEARTTLQNVRLKFPNNIIHFKYSPERDCHIYLRAYVHDGSTVIQTINIWDRAFAGHDVIEVDVPTYLEATIDLIPAGCSLILFWIYDPDIVANFEGTWTRFDVEIEAESVAFDSIMRGVRLIDLIRHNVKSISGLPVVAPEYDKVGNVVGPHYDNFAFNGYMLSNTPLYPLDMKDGVPDPDGKPFNNAFEDLMTIPLETCNGYQINRTEVEILPYGDFYKNIDLGGFIAATNSENKYFYDKDYFLKTLTFKYDKSSDERETNGENTIDDIHTKTQRLFPSKKTDGNKNIELKHVRSHFLMELQRRKALEARQSTSLQYDDTIFVADCVPRNPSDFSKITAVLLHRRGRTGNAYNFLELLNTGSNLVDIGINWILLGLRVGTIVYNRLPSENAGTWRVISVTPTVLKLELVTDTPWQPAHELGDALTRLEFTIPGVLYKTRTTEGFYTSGPQGIEGGIKGIRGANKYVNLMYSIGRNLKYWLPYMSTAMKYLKNKEITTTEFKINDKLETLTLTEFTAGLPMFKDKDVIKEVDIRHMRHINPIIHKVTVIVDCDAAMMLLDDIETKKGFVRVQVFNDKIIKGYPKKIDYIWSTNELIMELQEKNGRETVLLTRDGDTIYIDEVGYPIRTDLFSYEMNYDFITFRDSRRILIMSPTHWRDIEIEGIVYTNKIDFMNALNTFLA